ncbi:MAG TPA: TM2 domain-containing protein, partial [Thermoanaerobaculia bacterium]
SVAWVLWALLGWAGAHRFYLGREFTGLAMLFTGGGALLWWGVDAFVLDEMVRSFNRDQLLRKAEGRPPRALDAMPPLDEAALSETPAWVLAWRGRGRGRRRLRFAGDVVVLVFVAAALGELVGAMEGALEAVVAVLLLAVLTAMGSGPVWLHDLPVGRTLQRWIHRLRLFYRYHPPGPPVLLLLRPMIGILAAPFRARDRAEVRLYVELGAVFTAFFLLLEVVPEILLPAVLPGRSVDLEAFLAGWVGEVFNTFVLVYAFATPVGAILTRHLLIEETHRVPRVLAVVALVSVFLGMAM